MSVGFVPIFVPPYGYEDKDTGFQNFPQWCRWILLVTSCVVCCVSIPLLIVFLCVNNLYKLEYSIIAFTILPVTGGLSCGVLLCGFTKGRSCPCYDNSYEEITRV